MQSLVPVLGLPSSAVLVTPNSLEQGINSHGPAFLSLNVSAGTDQAQHVLDGEE